MSSKRSSKWWGCLRKRRFDNKGDASREAHKASRRTGEPIYIYWCRHCQGLHLTRKEQR
jgi:hypothetical protein